MASQHMDSQQMDREAEGSRRLSRGAVEQLAFAIFFFIVGVVVLVDTARLTVPATANVVGPKAFPYAVGGFLVVVSCWLAVVILRGDVGEPDDAELADANARTDWRAVLLVAGVIAAHAALIEQIGYILAAGLLFFGIAATLGARPLWKVGLIALALATVTYIAFADLLGVSLPASTGEQLIDQVLVGGR